MLPIFMANFDFIEFLSPNQWHNKGQGPRYSQLAKHIAAAIQDGRIGAGYQLPPERDLADLSDVSRVTVRKAIGKLVDDGLVDQRQGAGSFVREKASEPRLDYGLSSLTSFTEYMELRGYTSSSVILDRGVYSPRPDEMVALGLSPEDKLARIKRLRSADDSPLAIETSCLPADVLPDPTLVTTSLYAVLRQTGTAPVRAIQRIRATNLGPEDAALLQVPADAAMLLIDRTAYLPSGRPIEFTRGIYRSDVYDFVTELRLDSRP